MIKFVKEFIRRLKKNKKYNDWGRRKDQGKDLANLMLKGE